MQRKDKSYIQFAKEGQAIWYNYKIGHYIQFAR